MEEKATARNMCLFIIQWRINSDFVMEGEMFKYIPELYKKQSEFTEKIHHIEFS